MSPERERTVTVVSIVLTVVALGAYLTFSGSPLGMRARALVGIDGRLAPAVEPDSSGSYAFLETQRDGSPVGFSPCRPIRYSVNPQFAPPEWETYVTAATEEMERLTGLVFEDQGTTDSRDFSSRMLGDSALPVLIGWADEDEVDVLADDVAGVGGPTMVTLGVTKSYVTGSVVLDTDTTERLSGEPDGDQLQVALLMHELGHLVGLNHVDDPNELMYPEGPLRHDFGPGDREGLALLGNIPCR